MTKSRRADADLESRGSKSDGAVSAHAMLDATDWRGPFSFRKSSSNSVRIHRIRTTFAARSDGSNSNDFCRAHRPLRERKDGSNSNDFHLRHALEFIDHFDRLRRLKVGFGVPRQSVSAESSVKLSIDRSAATRCTSRKSRSFRSLGPLTDRRWNSNHYFETRDHAGFRHLQRHARRGRDSKWAGRVAAPLKVGNSARSEVRCWSASAPSSN